ncbi:hypothetical protein CQA49_07220 [Helicobacter sp. MIT 00-7814]|uniref:hypothetical protein n=1 Tax=unclassified Helicobacter TaxID=2593540 RepID=UPI000E1E7986|nr:MULTISPECIES: hypothetical protein [unclassified Helicobacter]RDU52700.1 hypothetical protein CQA37_08200 [Helicobacter sp. MIT 99-10781]RDU53134.1 hypothetical protein CQA49_07220 [Helicobacter sp. MIT 00-7814]
MKIKANQWNRLEEALRELEKLNWARIEDPQENLTANRQYFQAQSKVLTALGLIGSNWRSAQTENAGLRHLAYSVADFVMGYPTMKDKLSRNSVLKSLYAPFN